MDFATDADLAVEKFIIDSIQKKYPHHSILSEEKGKINTSFDFEWVIDLLDGTREFVFNNPKYYVNITLSYKIHSIVSVINAPSLKRLFSTSFKNGSTLNNSKIKVSNLDLLKESHIYIKLPDVRISDDYLDKYMIMLKKLIRKSYYIKSDTNAVHELCNVARGAAEAFILPSDWSSMQWWDIAAGIMLIQEAGGKVTDFNGNAIENRDISKGILASNGKIHDTLLDIVKNYYD